MEPEDAMTDTSQLANANAAEFRADHCKRILEAIKARPGMTAGEIAEAVGLEKVMVSRRLPEIEKDGAIYRDTARACTCDACSSKQLTWQPKSMQGQLFDVEPTEKGWFR